MPHATRFPAVCVKSTPFAAAALAAIAIASARTAAAAESAIPYPTVAAALQALHANRGAQFETQEGWTLVASREHGNPIQWFFTPAGHPAHPAVVKRMAVEEGGVGFIEVAAFCQSAQAACDALVQEFRQTTTEVARAAAPRRVTLDVGIALNDHQRVSVRHMVAEEGKAAEIRMDDLLKVVIVPTLDGGNVKLWTAMYEFDGNDYVLLAEPKFATAARESSAELEIHSASGDKFGFVVTPHAADPDRPRG